MTIHGKAPFIDKLRGILVFGVIMMMIMLAVVVLIGSGIFTPAQKTMVLFDEENSLDLPSPPPILSWLEQMIPTAKAEEDYEPEITETVEVGYSDLSAQEGLPDEWVNILLLATDSRSMISQNGRSDVMVIASIRAETGEVKLTSLARDLYVPIPRVGKDKLNAAFAYGGATLAMKTVNECFGLNIGSYVLVNIHAMSNIVDALGGVDIELIDNEYQYINYNVAVSEDYEGFEKSDARRVLTEQDVGLVHLDGLQAVAYARIRKMDNDLHRGSRQRILLEVMMRKILENADLGILTKIAIGIMSEVETNLPLTNIIGMAATFLRSDGLKLTQMSVPVGRPNYVEVGQPPMSVIEADLQLNAQEIHAFIYGED